MQVVREIKKVEGRRITIDLPDTFYGKEVEVIVIPFKRAPVLDDRAEWKRDFQSVSQWDISEEDVKIKSWPVEEF
ncbi:hypothetical protein [Desulfoferrobacter suflitae]|uniref:hypothetical protein n=1 Tax=Desulfoferrobacter suflitae TaxID=2865782 RepID=UPI002164D4F6|nr:hypothetical protein [Desulfoferrobacter suflitae]MCK8603302.1 hypothetical protein [Desulfoferrobacter suflitae]MDD3472295.1 hypothetical protein [Syntrophaceae bacterium]